VGVFVRRYKRRSAHFGASLIIVLILLGVVALTSAATLRNASVNERISNNFRMQLLAQQAAEAALRYCETQLTLADESRIASLKESKLSVNAAAPAWRQRSHWTGDSGGASAFRTSVPESVVVSAGSAFKPAQLPECVVDKQAIDGGVMYVVTARGFSPDYMADSRGFTLKGAVVWLQTGLAIRRTAASNLPTDSPASAGTLADRTWRRILNPPIH
jgi:type IV pilus assembly protein PilX